MKSNIDQIIEMGYDEVKDAIRILDDSILLFKGLPDLSEKDRQLLDDMIISRNQLNFHLNKNTCPSCGQIDLHQPGCAQGAYGT